jgi:hypothetical protein
LKDNGSGLHSTGATATTGSTGTGATTGATGGDEDVFELSAKVDGSEAATSGSRCDDQISPTVSVGNGETRGGVDGE